jgi:hypothetical protein
MKSLVARRYTMWTAITRQTGARYPWPGRTDRGGSGRFRSSLIPPRPSESVSDVRSPIFGRRSDPAGDVLLHLRRFRRLDALGATHPTRRDSTVITPRHQRVYGLDPDYQEVADAVRASMSIPLFFRPGNVDQHQRVDLDKASSPPRGRSRPGLLQSAVGQCPRDPRGLCERLCGSGEIPVGLALAALPRPFPPSRRYPHPRWTFR